MKRKNNNKIRFIIIFILIIITICIFIGLWQISKKQEIEKLIISKDYEKAYNLTNNWFIFKDNNLYKKVKIMREITNNYQKGKEELDNFKTGNEALKKSYRSLSGTFFLNVITEAISYEDILNELSIRDEVILIRDEASYIYLKELEYDLEKVLNNKDKWEFYPLGIENENKLQEVIKEVIYIANNTEIKDKFQKYISENKVKLTAKEIQYNIKNNLDKEFILEGVAELDDYYNYGYDNSEESYFCINVTPKNGSYSDKWYIYCKRYTYKDLYNRLMKSKQSLKLVCKVEKFRFEKNQGNMATATFIQIK